MDRLVSSLGLMIAGASVAVPPNRGSLTESIISLALVGAFIASLFLPVDAGARGVLNGIIGAVIGAYFTTTGKKYGGDYATGANQSGSRRKGRQQRSPVRS